MRVLLVVAAAAGCSSSVLTGNGLEDLETLTSLLDVDCSAEPLCGPVPRCMSDARHAGQVGMVQISSFANGQAYIKYLFTYDGAVVKLSDARPAVPDVGEVHCDGIAAAATGTDCWYWEARECDDHLPY